MCGKCVILFDKQHEPLITQENHSYDTYMDMFLFNLEPNSRKGMGYGCHIIVDKFVLLHMTQLISRSSLIWYTVCSNILYHVHHYFVLLQENILHSAMLARGTVCDGECRV